MDKQIIKINESQLRQIIKEGIKNLLLEYPYSPYRKETPEYYEWLTKTFSQSTIQYWHGKHPEWNKKQCEIAASKHNPYKRYENI